MTNEQATARAVETQAVCGCIDCACQPCACDSAKPACGCSED